VTPENTDGDESWMLSVEPHEIPFSRETGRIMSAEIAENRTTENQNTQFPPTPEFRYTV
jgi:hypothetical protein